MQIFGYLRWVMDKCYKTFTEKPPALKALLIGLFLWFAITLAGVYVGSHLGDTLLMSKLFALSYLGIVAPILFYLSIEIARAIKKSYKQFESEQHDQMWR